MRSALRLVPILFLMVLLTSCARATRESDDGGERRSGPNLLVRADLMTMSERSLYEVIDRFRPRWLQTRGITSVQGPAPIVVYLDNVRVGGVETLRTMRPESILEVRWVSATDATTRWGIGVGSGVIEVISARHRERSGP